MSHKTILSYGVIVICVLAAWVASLVILKQVVLTEVQKKINVPPMASSVTTVAPASVQVPTLVPSTPVPTQGAPTPGILPNPSGNPDLSGLFQSLVDSGVTPLGRRMFERSYIFAVTGDKCPQKTTVYEGPEQYFARQDGFILCWMYRDTIAFLRSELKKCPQGMIEHKDEGTKADDTYLQCKRAPALKDNAGRAPTPQSGSVVGPAPVAVDGLPPGLPPSPGQDGGSVTQAPSAPAVAE